MRQDSSKGFASVCRRTAEQSFTNYLQVHLIIFLGSQNLFVYCDIADFSFASNMAAQILRSVLIRRNIDEIVDARLMHLTMPSSPHFETIHVTMATDLSEDAKLETDLSSVKLSTH